MTDEQQEFTELFIRVDNEFGLVKNENLPNHTAAMRGRGKFVMVTNGALYQWRTKQEVYRFMAHLVALSADLPDEDGREHTYEEVTTAVRKLFYPES